jgi:hypothetical protein
MHGGTGGIDIHAEQQVIKVVVGAVMVMVMVVPSTLVRGHQECGARVRHVVN